MGARFEGGYEGEVEGEGEGGGSGGQLAKWAEGTGVVRTEESTVATGLPRACHLDC